MPPFDLNNDSELYDLCLFYLLKYKKLSHSHVLNIPNKKQHRQSNMFVQGTHLNFTVEKDPDETHELHRARAFAIAALLDEHPEYAHHFDAVVKESKRYIALHEARCHPMPTNFEYFVMRKPVVSTAPVRSTRGSEAVTNRTNQGVPTQTST